MYDVSDMTRESYEAVRKWTKELWKHNDNKKIPVIMLGNKTDLRWGKIPTLKLTECTGVANDLSQECGLEIPQLEISALAKENCELILDLIMDFATKSRTNISNMTPD